MKNVFTKSIVRSLVSVVTFAILAPLALADVAPEKGKIYMLTVWTGTSRNSRDTHQEEGENHLRNKAFHDSVVNSRKAFEEALIEVGLDVNDKKLIAEYVSLENAETSPQKIVDKIYELSEKAGQDDALFVYILSHGYMLDPELNFNEQRDKSVDFGFDREHYIMPLIETEQADVKRDAILRSNLLYFMRSKKHRLNVLITDSCSAQTEEGIKLQRTNVEVHAGGQNVSVMAPAKPDPSLYALRFLLTHATGDVSLNSTCPCFCYSVEDPKKLMSGGSYFAPKLDNVKKIVPDGNAEQRTFELSYGTDSGGQVFNAALIRTASRTIKVPANGYSIDDFFQDLGSDYDDMYAGYLEAVPTRLEKFALTQAFTTLTSFNVEDDRTGNSTRDNEVASKTNNRVKEVYEHNDSMIGSDKTNNPTISIRFVKN